MDLSQLGLIWVIAVFFAGIVLLFGGGHFLVEGSSRLARLLGIHPIIVGLTVVAFGTSMPEFLVSLTAALKGQADVALGNIVGSNVANVGLILGLSALCRPVSVHPKLLRFEVPLVMAVSCIFWAMCLNGVLGRVDGLMLLLGLALYLTVIIKGAKADALNHARTTEKPRHFRSVVLRNILFLLLGIVGLKYGADWVVDAALEISHRFGVPELILGLTIVAVGTSLPELATSIVAAVKKEGDISIGNIIGSNLFNMMAVAGPTALIKPLAVREGLTSNHLPIMVGITVLLWPFLRSGRQVNRIEGALLLVGYVAITFWWAFSG